MNSMTGFGKAELVTKQGTFTVEISSVNNRYLEVSARLPRQFSALEYRVRELIGEHLNRGKVFAFIGFTESEQSPNKYYINKNAMISLSRQLQQISKELNLSGGVTISDLLVFPEVTRLDDAIYDEKAIWESMEKAVTKALKGLLKMRQKEGAAMARDMKKRLATIKKLNQAIKKDAKLVVDRYRERLHTRLEELLSSAQLDPGRLEQEITILADRSDISEECTRLSSHINQYQADLTGKQAVGKRLNFILQEMHREANTIASKASESSITSAVISLKEEIEKLREMVQNVE